MAQKRMDTLGLRNIIVRQADGSAGLQGEGTFDRILVTAAFDDHAALLCRSAGLRRLDDRAADHVAKTSAGWCA